MPCHADIMRQRCALVLDQDFTEDIKISQLMFEEPFLGVLVTNDDEVFAVGADTKDYFGLGAVTVIPKVSKVKLLCEQKIVKFSAGEDHVLALSEGGVVYAWGCNSHGQLGNDSTYNSTVPIVVTGNLTDQIVTQIDCGRQFSVALSDEGKVFTWGKNEYGRTGQKTFTESTKVPEMLEIEDEIVYIACNVQTTLCLARSGDVYAFGYHGDGNLGISTKDHSHTPVKVEFPGRHWIQAIRCGNFHNLALTNSGLLFAWGHCKNGQVGSGTESGYCQVPTQINFSIDGTFSTPVMSIMVEGDTSSAVDIYGNEYIWGSVNGGKVLRPADCELHLNSNFQLFPNRAKTIPNDLVKIFDDETSSDLVFTVDGTDIHVHKCVLEMRSKYFKAMFGSSWKEKESKKIVIEHYSYEIYRAFLRFLYSEKLSDLDLEQTMELMDLAKCALENELMDVCIERMKGVMAFDNVARIFSVSLTLGLDDLVDYCVRFAMRSMKSVIESEAFMTMHGDHVKELFRHCLKHGSFW